MDQKFSVLEPWNRWSIPWPFDNCSCWQKRSNRSSVLLLRILHAFTYWLAFPFSMERTLFCSSSVTSLQSRWNASRTVGLTEQLSKSCAFRTLFTITSNNSCSSAMMSLKSSFLLARTLDRLSILLGIAAYRAFSLLLNSATLILEYPDDSSFRMDCPKAIISSEMSSILIR